MKEKFKVGDKVTFVNTLSRHYGEEGVVYDVKKRSSEGSLLSTRYVVKFNNPSITPVFICHELDLEHTISYNREEKLKKLGI